MGSGRYLFISDLQIPFEHAGALDFVTRIKKQFKIPDENCYCVGDELDFLWGGAWKKSPNVDVTAVTELKIAREKLKKWYAAFPQMKLAISNHGTRYWRKALEAEIPSEMLRRYEEIIHAPRGWIWKKHWIIPDRQSMIMEHGDDHGGQHPHKQAALYNGLPTIIGHHHSKSGIVHFRTAHQKLWGMVTGSLIDFESYAFDYARAAKEKPVLSIGVVVDGGKTPLLVPFEE